MGREEEAFAQWEEAASLAQRKQDSELISVCKVYQARGRLLSKKDSAQAVLDEVNREAANIKTDSLYVAFSWQVKGLALRELRSWREAEDAVNRALAIHEKEMYLENASYDWYLIGSIRSLAGNTQGALQALDSAIAIDRRIENSWALAAAWRAIGDVQMKAGNRDSAMEAYRHSRAIFSALENEQETAEIDKRMGN
jgi:tetratricopeptide (TPR) repeat protein